MPPLGPDAGPIADSCLCGGVEREAQRRGKPSLNLNERIIAHPNRAVRRPCELSLLLEPIEHPDRSFILITYGRQPHDPANIFPGRYLLVLEYSP